MRLPERLFIAHERILKLEATTHESESTVTLVMRRLPERVSTWVERVVSQFERVSTTHERVSTTHERDERVPFVTFRLHERKLRAIV